jgi:hypothetical protein
MCIPRRPSPPPEVLIGDYFDLNAGYESHFGHLLTQGLSKAWGFNEAKSRLPALKALVRCKPGLNTSLERSLYCDGFGIPASDLIVLDHDVALSSYVSPTIGFQYPSPSYVSPLVSTTWHEVAKRLTSLASIAPDQKSERVFVGRKPGGKIWRRTCRNYLDVERFFTELGFFVVYPEMYSLPDQAAIFSGAKVLAGFAGSALFNMMFSERLEQLVVLSHEGYQADNEWLIAVMAEVPRCDWFFSPADVSGSSRAARISAWEFDFARNGHALKSLLRT